MRLVASILATFSVSDDLHLEPGVFFSGSYQTGMIEEEYHYHLKFYEDCTVIGTSSTGTARQIAGWFHRQNPELRQSDYTIQGNRIAFTLGGLVKVEYEGTMSDIALTLDTYSRYNGNRNRLVYEFVPSGGNAIRNDLRTRGRCKAASK